LRTWQGQVFHGALALPFAVSRAVGGPTLEGVLLARHRIIDSILEEKIEGGIGQVVEVACGMSPRGWRFSERYGDRITYIEADLPAMARRKREALERMGSLGERHRVVEVDILRDGGPGSLEALADTLDPAAGLAIVTEGLLTYLDGETVEAVWARIARVLTKFDRGVYLADLRLDAPDRSVPERAFALLLGAFVRGKVHAYGHEGATPEGALRNAGFERVQLHRGDKHPAAGEAGTDPAAAAIHIIEAQA
jgi:O-methyltransferase involved in polyketide biosynthesis